jgi:uncharacterized membrane protein (DUF4010 family)
MWAVLIVAIYFLPNETVDPWNLFNPHRFGWIVLAIAGLEVLGHRLSLWFGEERGSVAAGFFGGYVSSTAVTLNQARRARQHSKSCRAGSRAIIAAQCAALTEVFLIVAVTSKHLAVRMGPSLAASAAACILCVFLLRPKPNGPATETPRAHSTNWRSVLTLAAVLSLILAVISIAKLWLGTEALLAVSALTGLFELHGVALANATIFQQEQVSASIAVLGIQLAIVSSFLAKLILAISITGFSELTKTLAGAFAVITLVGALTLGLQILLP